MRRHAMRCDRRSEIQRTWFRSRLDKSRLVAFEQRHTCVALIIILAAESICVAVFSRSQ